jgi:hypothetical protein
VLETDRKTQETTMTTLTTFNTRHITEITRKAQRLLPKRTDNGDPLVLEVEYGIRKASDNGELTCDTRRWNWDESDLEDLCLLKRMVGDEIEAGVTLDLYCYLVRDYGTQYEDNAMLVNLDATFDGRKWIVTEQ